MSDHDTTLPPETDDEIRARLRAFAEEVTERVDTEAALQRMPRRSRPPTIRLLAIAACLVAVVAVAAVVTADRLSVDTVPAQSTECPSTTQPRAITQGAQMNKRFAAPVASAATAILLLGACGDDDDSSTTTTEAAADGPTTLAKGEDVEFVGDDGFGGQTLSIDVVEENGEVTGEFSVSDIVFVRVDCAETYEGGFVRVAGTVTEGDPTHLGDVGDLLFLTIREGDPDSAGPGSNDYQAESCTELLESVPDDGWAEGLVDVEDGSDIETD
jgi:hypothetical protein